MSNLYVLNGGAPEKVSFFGKYCAKYNPILMDNNGDNYNKSNFSQLVKKLDEKFNVLITSEFQLIHLTKMMKKDPRYMELEKRCIYLRSYNSIYPDSLCSKKFFPSIPGLGDDSFILSGSKLSKMDLSDYIVKPFIGTGSDGVLGVGESTKYHSNKSYLVQKKFNEEDYYNLTVPVVIRDSRISFLVIMEGAPGKSLGFFKWKCLRLTTKFDSLIIASILKLIKHCGLTSGALEPEFVINKSTNEVRLIDHNPRWSYDCSVIHDILEQEGVTVNMLDYINGTSQFKNNINSKWYSLGEIYRPIEVL